MRSRLTRVSGHRLCVLLPDRADYSASAAEYEFLVARLLLRLRWRNVGTYAEPRHWRESELLRTAKKLRPRLLLNANGGMRVHLASRRLDQNAVLPQPLRHLLRGRKGLTEHREHCPLTLMQDAHL